MSTAHQPPTGTVNRAHQQMALWMGTLAFTISFAVWTIFSIIGLKIKDELGLNDTEFGLLVAMPILTGSLVRDLSWRLDRTIRWPNRLLRRHDRWRSLDVAAALATTSYLAFLLAALCVGIVGGSVHRRDHLRLQVVPQGTSGHRARHRRRGQYRRSGH